MDWTGTKQGLTKELVRSHWLASQGIVRILYFLGSGKPTTFPLKRGLDKLAQFQLYNSSPIKYTGLHAQGRIGRIDINPSMKTAVSNVPGAKVT